MAYSHVSLGEYVANASLVYNHYRQKSLQEWLLRRVVRRNAWFVDKLGTNVTGEAQEQFIREAIESELAQGFLSKSREVEQLDYNVKNYFIRNVEAEYNYTRARIGLMHCNAP